MSFRNAQIDKTAVVDGVWTEFVVITPDNQPGEIGLCLALADIKQNVNYRKALQAAMKPYERVAALYAGSNGTDVPPKLAAEINAVGLDVFVNEIVKGWRGPMVEGVPYSPEAAKELFQAYPELQASAEAECAKFHRYRTATLEQAAGN